MMPKPQTKRAFHIYHHGNPQSRPLRARSYPPKKWGNLILSSILLKVSARGTPTTMITTIPRAATPMRRQLLRIGTLASFASLLHWRRKEQKKRTAPNRLARPAININICDKLPSCRQEPQLQLMFRQSTLNNNCRIQICNNISFGLFNTYK